MIILKTFITRGWNLGVYFLDNFYLIRRIMMPSYLHNREGANSKSSGPEVVCKNVEMLFTKIHKKNLCK